MNAFDTFSKSSLFSYLAKSEVNEMYRLGTYRKLKAGDTIFRQGDPGDGMYVLLEGEIELSFPGRVERKMLKTGDYFGELALIAVDQKRTGTAIAKTDLVLHRFSEASFAALERDHPAIVTKLLRCTVRYMIDSEDLLVSKYRNKTFELERTLDYLKRTREELDYQELLSRTDHLTGLYNRRCFDIEIANFTEEAEKLGEGLALIIIDVDKFKAINDDFGHRLGDQVLRNVSDIIRGAIRNRDLACRIGGDEFVVLAPGMPLDVARERAEVIRQRTRQLPVAESKNRQLVFVSVSIGGALYVKNESPEELFERTDKQLYEAKRQGGNAAVWAPQS